MPIAPLILSTWSFGRTANAAGWSILDKGGTALDAVEAGCRAVELDPTVNSVGVGGIPDRDGHVTLDGCVMVGPTPGACGSVAAISRFAHPVSIARRVMEATPHVMLVGERADAFAADQGFEPARLLTDAAREKWEQHRRDGRKTTMTANREEQLADPRNTEPRNPEPDTPHDTVGVLALDSTGSLAGACSTSGWPYKTPGRVGDSPIIGHGLYVDQAVGAAVATGHGELVMGVCGSFLAVELMRRGAEPLDAITDVLMRIVDLNDLTTEDQVGMIALTPTGQWATAATAPAIARRSATHRATITPSRCASWWRTTFDHESDGAFVQMMYHRGHRGLGEDKGDQNNESSVMNC